MGGNLGGKPTDKDVMEALHASGYLMEQEVATELERLGYFVQTNKPFEDVDEHKSREIDVWATHRFHRDEVNRIAVSVELYCECKNNDNPFVFIGRRKGEIDKRFRPSHYNLARNSYDLTCNQMTRTFDAFTYLGLRDSHYYYRQDWKAVQFCKMVRQNQKWQANHDGIYDAMFYPLAKALVARGAEFAGSHASDWCYFRLLCPIVVLRGDILYVDSMHSSPCPQNVPHISFTRELMSKSVNGHYLVDFVRQGHLASFITTTIVPFVDAIIALANVNPSLIREPRVGVAQFPDG